MDSRRSVFAGVGVGVTIVITVTVAAWSHGLSGYDIAAWTIGAALFAGLVIGTTEIEERVMPNADPLVQVGFGSSLVVAIMAAVYAAYGFANDQARSIVLGLVGATAFASFAWVLAVQQRRREQR